MTDKTQRALAPVQPAAAGQEIFTDACNELFKDAYAGLLNDRPVKALSFENVFALSSEFSPEELFKESTSARLFC